MHAWNHCDLSTNKSSSASLPTRRTPSRTFPRAPCTATPERGRVANRGEFGLVPQDHHIGRKAKTHTQVALIPPWEDQCEWHRMTRMTRPDCAVMCNLINTHTDTSATNKCRKNGNLPPSPHEPPRPSACPYPSSPKRPRELHPTTSCRSDQKSRMRKPFPQRLVFWYEACSSRRQRRRRGPGTAFGSPLRNPRPLPGGLWSPPLLERRSFGGRGGAGRKRGCHLLQ